VQKIVKKKTNILIKLFSGMRKAKIKIKKAIVIANLKVKKNVVLYIRKEFINSRKAYDHI